MGERSWKPTAAALAITETVSWGILYYAFAVLLTPMNDEFGWSTAAASGAFSMAILTSGLAAPLVGRWIDRGGPRRVMTGGSVLAALLVAAWAHVDSLLTLYGVWALIGVAMAATLYEPAIATVARYPDRQRRTALLVITTAAALASTVFTPLSSLLVHQLGWRPALLVLAGLLAVLTVPLHRFALPGTPVVAHPASSRAREEQPGRMIRDPAFVRIVAAFTLSKAVGVAVTVHIVAYLVTQGRGPATAAALAGAIGAAKIGGRAALTIAHGYVHPATMAVVALAAQGGATLALLARPTAAGAALFVVMFGAASGAVTLLRPELVAQHFGTCSFGRLNGTAALAETVTAAAAPFAIGLATTVSGSYITAWLSLATTGLIAATVVAPLRESRPSAVAP